jgi:hypothetical protein
VAVEVEDEVNRIKTEVDEEVVVEEEEAEGEVIDLFHCVYILRESLS